MDLTDWLALIVLVAVWREPHCEALPNPDARKRILALAAASVAVVLFTATSVVRFTPTPDAHAFIIPADAFTVLTGLDRLGFRPSSYEDAKTHAHTVTISIRHPPERWLTVNVELRDLTRDTSEIRMVRVYQSYNGPLPSVAVLESEFDVQVLQPLAEWLKTEAATARDSSFSVPPGT
jgi:hypothetical protein